MPDRYANVIRQKGDAEAARVLADECRKRDRAVLILREELQRLRRVCLSAADDLLKPLDGLDADSLGTIPVVPRGRCEYQLGDVDPDRCKFREASGAADGLEHACERPLCPWPERRDDDSFWAARNGGRTNGT